MSLNFTAAYTSRIKKRASSSSRNNPLIQLHRKSSSSSPRKSSLSRQPSPPPLCSSATVQSSIWSIGWPFDRRDDSPAPTDVVEAIEYILQQQFTPLPPGLTGLGLSRDSLAEVLNFRRLLPPVVPVHHLYSILPSATQTEREINSLTADGTLRRVQIKTNNAVPFEGVIQTDEFLKIIAQSKSLDIDAKNALLELLEADPSITSIMSDDRTPLAEDSQVKSVPIDIVMSLLNAGFLTLTPSNLSLSAPEVDITTLTPTTAMPNLRAYKPILDKDHSHISTLTSLSSMSARKPSSIFLAGSSTYFISVPNMGLLTHLYSSSKSHLVDILRKQPHKEATLSFSREKWDGGVSKGKKQEGKFEGRTKKWRDFKGLNVDWVIGGLSGAGVIEAFEVIGAGRAYRLVKGN